MDWSQFDMDRLYELYQNHFNQLRADVIEVNRSLGSTQPDKTRMERLSRPEFERLITTRLDEPEVTLRWVRCIVRGHEHEFPDILAA